MNKQGQAVSIIFFFVIVLGIFVVATLGMMVVNKILTPFSTALNSTSPQASNAVSGVQTTFINLWDWVVLMFFLFNLILLFVSAFMVDIHPAFLIIYIFACFFLILFGSSFLFATHTIIDKFAPEQALMPMTNWLLDNFNLVLLGIIVLSGVIMYAKFKTSGGVY